MGFCTRCGSELPDGVNYCSKCGMPIRKLFEKKALELGREKSAWWYLAPLLIGLIGGLVAYFLIRKDDPKKARNCLIIGFGSFVVYTGIALALGF